MCRYSKTQWMAAVLLVAAALISAFWLAGRAADPVSHAAVMEALEEKQATVLELTAASTAASAAITLLPGDAATPIAEKLADLSTGFLLVLCAIYLEKYLLTITGYAAFRFLVPAACVLLVFSLFRQQAWSRALARRLLAFAAAIVLVIPVSVGVSNLIEGTYQASLEATLDAAREATEEVADTAGTAEETDEGFFSGLWSKVTEGVTGAVSGVSEKVGEMVNRFLEALAVLLVTSCVIPLLVLAFFVWLAKLLLRVSLPAEAGAGARRACGPGGQTE